MLPSFTKMKANASFWCTALLIVAFSSILGTVCLGLAHPAPLERISGRGAVPDEHPGYEKSMQASYGFFEDSNQKWVMRQLIFDEQEKRQMQPRHDKFATSDKNYGAWFQFNYEPNFSCDLEKRIGRAGDGGKWVCNPHRTRELTGKGKKKCVVFSIGSNNDFSFEEGILKELPGCEVHTFDHTVIPTKVPAGVKFHRWGLGAEDSGNVYTLQTIMRRLNIGPDHSIEILKVDIEGHEWDVFVDSNGKPGLLAQKDFPFVRQMLIELHPTKVPPMRKFFELMGNQQYVITHKEPNTMQGGRLVEYGFLKVNMTQ